MNHLRSLRLVSGGLPVEWFDCEALYRRHRLGRGALPVFDYISTSGEALRQRKELLAQAFPAHDYSQPPSRGELYAMSGRPRREEQKKSAATAGFFLAI